MISVSVGLRRTATLAIAYLALAAIELLIVILVPKLSTAYPFGILDFLFIYLLAPLVLLPYRFWENAAALLMCAALPNIFVLFDLAPGFPLVLYNVMVWPACLVAVYAQHQFDELFRRVFLYCKQIHELALNDALTALGNRRYRWNNCCITQIRCFMEQRTRDATGSSASRTDPVLPAPTTACIIFP